MAIRVHDWKAIRRGNNGEWQLYNLANDPTEQNDIAEKHPERVKELAQQWEAWWNDKGSVQ